MMKLGIVVVQTILKLFVAAIGLYEFYSQPNFPPYWDAMALCGAAIMLTGFVILMAGVVSLRNQLTISVVPRKALITTGIYRFTRNPIYLSSILIPLGWSLLFHSTACAGGAALLAGALRLKIGLEETELEKKFGDDYRAYQARTARWFGFR